MGLRAKLARPTDNTKADYERQLRALAIAANQRLANLSLELAALYGEVLREQFNFTPEQIDFLQKEVLRRGKAKRAEIQPKGQK